MSLTAKTKRRDITAENFINQLEDNLTHSLRRTQHNDTGHPISAFIVRPASVRLRRSPVRLDSPSPLRPITNGSMQRANDSSFRSLERHLVDKSPTSKSRTFFSTEPPSLRFTNSPTTNNDGGNDPFIPETDAKGDAEVSAYLRTALQDSPGVNWRLLTLRRRACENTSKIHRAVGHHPEKSATSSGTAAGSPSSDALQASRCSPNSTSSIYPIFAKHGDFKFFKTFIPGSDRDSANGSLNDDNDVPKQVVMKTGSAVNAVEPSCRRGTSMRARSTNQSFAHTDRQSVPQESGKDVIPIDARSQTKRCTSLQRRLSYNPSSSLLTERARRSTSLKKRSASPTKETCSIRVVTRFTEPAILHQQARDSPFKATASDLRLSPSTRASPSPPSSSSRTRAPLSATPAPQATLLRGNSKSAIRTNEAHSNHSPQTRVPNSKKPNLEDKILRDPIISLSPKHPTLARTRSKSRPLKSPPTHNEVPKETTNPFPDAAVDLVDTRLEQLARHIVLLRKRVEKDYAEAGSCSPGDDIYADEEVGIVSDGRTTGMHPVIANSLRNIRLLEANVQELFDLLYPNEVELWFSKPLAPNGHL